MKELVEMIQSFAYSNGKDNKKVLSDLLYYIIGYFNPERKPNPRWTYNKEQNEQFHAMLMQWLKVMDEGLQDREWYDPWGDLFMELTPKGGLRGQFFTPTSICELMADISKPEDAEPTTPCNGFGNRVTVADCACGSGRNLLAAHAKFIKANARKPYLVGEDIDIICCQMTAINLMAHGCFGEVICHNTLTEPKELRVGFVVNEGLYPFTAMPTIRVFNDPLRFVALR